jgi:hypothetical protein
MNCTNCGSARMQPTGNCGTCGEAFVSPATPSTEAPATWEHPDGSGPVDVDATLEFVMSPIEELDRAAAALAAGHHPGPDAAPVPVSPYVGYAAEEPSPARHATPAPTAHPEPAATPAYAEPTTTPTYAWLDSTPTYTQLDSTPTYTQLDSTPTYTQLDGTPTYTQLGAAPVYTEPGNTSAYPELAATPYTHPGATPAYAGFGAPQGYSEFGAAEGYGIGPGGLPDGPTAGRPYVGVDTAIQAAHFGTVDQQAAQFSAVEPQAAQFTAVETQAAYFNAAGAQAGSAGYHAEAQATWSQMADGSWAQSLPEPVTAPPSAAYSDLPGLYGTPTETPNKFSLVALVLAGLALLVLPAGLASMFFASMARNRAEPLGPMSFTVAAGASLVGCLVGAAALVTLLR